MHLVDVLAMYMGVPGIHRVNARVLYYAPDDADAIVHILADASDASDDDAVCDPARWGCDRTILPEGEPHLQWIVERVEWSVPSHDLWQEFGKMEDGLLLERDPVSEADVSCVETGRAWRMNRA